MPSPSLLLRLLEEDLNFISPLPDELPDADASLFELLFREREPYVTGSAVRTPVVFPPSLKFLRCVFGSDGALIPSCSAAVGPEDPGGVVLASKWKPTPNALLRWPGRLCLGRE